LDKNLFMNKDMQVRCLLRLSAVKTLAGLVQHNLVVKLPEEHEKLFLQKIEP